VKLFYVLLIASPSPSSIRPHTRNANDVRFMRSASLVGYVKCALDCTFALLIRMSFANARDQIKSFLETSSSLMLPAHLEIFDARQRKQFFHIQELWRCLVMLQSLIGLDIIIHKPGTNHDCLIQQKITEKN
jgi:hypothetical protein